LHLKEVCWREGSVACLCRHISPTLPSTTASIEVWNCCWFIKWGITFLRVFLSRKTLTFFECGA